MRRFLVIAIPIAALVFFVCIMLSGSFLKKPFGKNDDVVQEIENLTEDVYNESWEEASRKVEDLDLAWKTVLKRIQFSSERDEINDITSNIARLRGAVLAQDKSNSLIELKDAYQHWNELGN